MSKPTAIDALSIAKLDLKQESQLDAIFPIIKQLRPHLNIANFKELIVQMSSENYEVWACLNAEKEILAIAGIRVYTDFVRGPHLYIDDLICDQRHRSSGVGAFLLHEIEKVAMAKGIPNLRLSCVIENLGALKFYERLGWQRRAYALVKKITA